jgi:hypothetical protein
VGNFCQGTALDELAILGQVAAAHARQVPHAEVDAYLHPAYFDEHFEAGLGFLIDGIAKRHG